MRTIDFQSGPGVDYNDMSNKSFEADPVVKNLWLGERSHWMGRGPCWKLCRSPCAFTFRRQNNEIAKDEMPLRGFYIRLVYRVICIH